MVPRLDKFFADRRPGLQAAFVFGSHARGSTHADSDLDVAILLDASLFGSHRERAGEAARLATALIEATHENAVDVIVLNDVPPELAVAVLDTGRLLRCTAAEALHTFSRTARLRFADVQPFLDRMRRIKLQALVR